MARIKKAQLMREHINKLCSKYGLTRRVGSSYIGYAIGNNIKGPEISGPISYLIALHEIAHTQVNGEMPLLEEEAWCWLKAISSSIVPITDAMLISVRNKLETYVDAASSKDFPANDGTSVFWEFYEKLNDDDKKPMGISPL